MSTPIQLVLERLAKRGCLPKKSASGWSSRCPAHDDQSPSLSVSLGDEGQVLLHCHTGCETSAILNVLGLALTDLFPEKQQREIDAAYDYTDESGQLLFQVVRFKPKGFALRRPDGNGGWIWNAKGMRKVVYRLHDLIEEMKQRAPGDRVVYVPEGEKDVDRLRTLGFAATTNPGGAGKWTEDFTRQLKAAGVEQVIVVPDNDQPGEKHALQVVQSLVGAGICCKVVHLPGLTPIKPDHGEDVSDWLDAGHTAAELAEVVAVTPAFAAESPPTSITQFLVPLGQLLSEPEEDKSWVVDQTLPAAGFSLCAGKPKAGKSTMARDLALKVARGEPWLGRATTQGTVFYLAFEEKRSEVRNHFRRMGATEADPIFVFIAAMPEDGFAQLEEAVAKEKPALIIVDTLFKLLPMENINDYSMVTPIVDRLLRLARDSRAHALAVHHAGKGDRPGGDSILGSTALFGTADTALILKRSARYRVLYSQQRYGKDLPETVVTLDPETGRVSAECTREEADVAKVSEDLLENLRGLAEPVNEAAVHEGVEGRKRVKETALRKLVREGKVRRTGKGRKGNPFIYEIIQMLPPPNSGEGEKRITDSSLSACESGTNSPSRENADKNEVFDSADGDTGPDTALSASLIQEFEMLPPDTIGEGENGNTNGAKTANHPSRATARTPHPRSAASKRKPRKSDLEVKLEGPHEMCRACGLNRFWVAHDGRMLCAICHPPAPSAVAEWVNG